MEGLPHIGVESYDPYELIITIRARWRNKGKQIEATVDVQPADLTVVRGRPRARLLPRERVGPCVGRFLHYTPAST